MGQLVDAPSLAAPAASPLLTVAEARPRVRELQCWSVAQHQAVQARLLALHMQWCSGWGLAVGQRPAADGGPRLTDREAQEALALQLFGPPSAAATGRSNAEGMAQSLASEAWADWLHRMADALGQTHPTSPPHPWDGSLEVAVPWWGGFWPIRLEAAAIVRVLGKEASPQPARPAFAPLPLVPLTSAMAHQPLRVTAQLAPVALTLGQLEGLRVGDIIPLPQRLDEPATVVLHTSDATSTNTGTPWCVAWLGQRQGRMAAELSPLEP